MCVSLQAPSDRFQAMSRRPYRRVARRRPRQSGCLSGLVRLVLAVVLCIGLYTLLVRPRIGALIGSEVARLAGFSVGSVSNPGLADAVPGGAADFITALPSEPLSLAEAEANTYIDTFLSSAEVAPLEDVDLRLHDGRAEATVFAFGTSGVASAVPVAQDGRLVLQEPRIDGALGLAVSADELAETLTAEINAELARQGRVIEDIRIVDDRLLLLLGER
jgi:hypothetical protein